MPDDLVLIDTDAWSLLFMGRRDRNPEVTEWRRLLVGKVIVIAAQTEGELRFGAVSGGWGERRLRELEDNLRRTPTAPVTSEVIRAFATVRADCMAMGHALHNKHHHGDAWVAATAAAYNLPLLSGDGIFSGAPGVRLFHEVDPVDRITPTEDMDG